MPREDSVTTLVLAAAAMLIVWLALQWSLADHV